MACINFPPSQPVISQGFSTLSYQSWCVSTGGEDEAAISELVMPSRHGSSSPALERRQGRRGVLSLLLHLLWTLGGMLTRSMAAAAVELHGSVPPTPPLLVRVVEKDPEVDRLP